MTGAHRDTQPTLPTACMLACLVAGPAIAQDASVQYLADDAADRITHTVQDWGILGLNRVAHPPNRKPNRLRIKDVSYDRGLGCHANGEILVELDGAFKTFEADIGVQWQGGRTGSVVFQVLVDDEKRFDSGVMTEQDPSRKVCIPVEGADELLLIVRDAGDGITCDAANWANARLIRNPAAKDIRRARPSVDIARFGHVVTSDPARLEGTRAKRTEEMPAEDVFMSKQLLPAADGTYAVPVWQDGVSCIGLEWIEPRFLRQITLTLAEPADIPPGKTIQAQGWNGQSAWQGKWQTLGPGVREGDGRWTWRVYPKNLRAATQKVRWVLPASAKPTVVKSLSAQTISSWRDAEIRIESARPVSGKRCEIEVYNGVIVDPASGGSPVRCTWDTARPLRLKVRYTRPRRCKTDRTVLRFCGLGTPFGVAVEDVMANEAVYVRHAGVFVTREPPPTTLDAYLEKIAGRKTVLERVRDLPDQSFAQALETVHNPVQDRGPMMLSLACDNRKFVAHRDGVVSFKRYEKPDDAISKGQYALRNFACQLRPRFGQGQPTDIARHLEGQWLPMPVTRVTSGGLVYRQRTFVAPIEDAPATGAPVWYRQHAVCVVEYDIKNAASEAKNASLELALVIKGNKPIVKLERSGGGVIARADDRLLAFIDLENAEPLHANITSGKVALAGRLPARGAARCCVYLPAWRVAADKLALFEDGSKWPERVEAYWRELLAPAMQIDLPDRLLTDAIRASQVHCMLAARCEDGSQRVSPWTSADRYGPLESESHSIIRGMDMMGHHGFARRGLAFFIKRYNAAGYLTTGYTMMGTGWHLWTLAEHYDRTQDRPWLQRVAPEIARASRWITRQRAKTKRLDAHGRKVPEYGLVPAGVFADWPRFTFTTFQAAQYCAGLTEAARVLSEVDHPDAKTLAQDARQYRQDILRAYRWTQARSPVLRLSTGHWVPAYPPLITCFGDVGGFFPGEDGSRAWCKNAMAHQLVVNRVIDPLTEEVAWMMDHVEDVEFLRGGLGDYPADKVRQDWFNLGGFNKCQPYYRRSVEIYALRDDVKPFIRGYFNTIPSLLSLENLSFWEHFSNRGGWNKTHETGWFLCQTRIMLVMERGQDLWLAPFVTTHWLGDGMRVAVRNAPTRFGKVSYSIVSAIRRGVIEAVIDAPTRSKPKALVLRLRHPQGKPIHSVRVNGHDHRSIDPAKQTIHLEPSDETIKVQAFY